MRLSSIISTLAVLIWVPAATAQTGGPQQQRDVFVVGRDTAIGNPLLGFRPTRVELPNQPLSPNGRRELVRMLLAEQGFAHRALPLGAPGLTLHANGRLTIEAKELQKHMYEQGTCADAGDRVLITDLAFAPDRIIVDVNGGPYLKHRFLRHVEVNGIPLAGNGQVGEHATGTRIVLLFEGAVPDVTAAEVKSLLEPLLDFGLKTSEQAYADTLPEPLKKAISEHEVLVGMNRRMVLAALGQPESKLRERATGSTSGEVFEEWIYGHTPQTIRFVKFRADRVILLKVAALGKPIELHDKDELAAYRDPSLTHTIALGDAASTNADEGTTAKPPSLRGEGEAAPADPNALGRVHLPGNKKSPPATDPDSQDPQAKVPEAKTPAAKTPDTKTP